MALEVISGWLEPATPTRKRGRYARYSALTFITANGLPSVLPKVAAGGAMVEEIARGGEGRYFLARPDGGTALVGVVRPDGATAYAHYMNLEPVLLAAGVLGCALAVARFGFDAPVPLIGAVLGPLLIAAWFYLRMQRKGQQQAFELLTQEVRSTKQRAAA